MSKETLNYNLIKEALKEYMTDLSDDAVIAKQSTEEIYKIKDLENSKCFIVNKLKDVKHDVKIHLHDIFDLISTYLNKNINTASPIPSHLNKKYSLQIQKCTSVDASDWFVNLFIDMLRGRGKYITEPQRKLMRKAIRELKDYEPNTRT